jgi:uncharacterized protein
VDPKLADLLRKALAGDCSAIVEVGLAFYTGTAIRRDYEQAASWFRKGAAAGDSDSMFNLAAMYENGEGVRRDRQQAVDWYRKAAGHGDKEAKTALNRLGESVFIVRPSRS